MITADRHCDMCGKRRLVRASGLRWLCVTCWGLLLDAPWDDGTAA